MELLIVTLEVAWAHNELLLERFEHIDSYLFEANSDISSVFVGQFKGPCIKNMIQFKIGSWTKYNDIDIRPNHCKYNPH
jgi:hypothetical protein